jgi:glutamyl-tRNA synthetase
VALFNWLFARGRGGTFVVRMEDTDRSRSRPQFETAILDDLRWLGLDWDEGPDNGGEYGPYRQSERLELYHEAAGRLLDSGCLYRCFCTPEEIARHRKAERAAGRMPHYSGRCRGLSDTQVEQLLATGTPHTLRVAVPDQPVSFKDRVKGEVVFPAGGLGDFIAVRADGTASYNFACVVDDAAMEVTHVIRGEDLLPSTPKQLVLYAALGLEPPAYAHLPMVLDEGRHKLSKRHGTASVGSLRERGYLPEAVLNALALLGWSPPDGAEYLSLAAIRRQFSLDRAARANASFDVAKLDWLNGQHLRRLDGAALLELARPHLEAAGMLDREPEPELTEWLGRALKAAAPSADRPVELVERLEPLWKYSAQRVLEDPEARRELQTPETIELLRAFLGVAEGPVLQRSTAFIDTLRGLGRERGLKGRKLFHPLRLALTGESSGMELGKMVPLMARLPESLQGSVPGPLARVRAILEGLEAGDGA